VALYVNSEHHRCRGVLRPVFKRWRCTDVSNNSEWLFLGAGSFPVCCTGMFWEADRGTAGWDNSVLLAQGKVISSKAR